MRALSALALALALLPALAGACWTGPDPEPPRARPAPPAGARPTLYERLGGPDAIRAIVDEALQQIVADSRINTYFANVDAPALRRHLEDWLCAQSGGACRYGGKSMRMAHSGMRINGDEFEAFVEAFTKALDRLRVGGREKVELVLIIRRPRPEIIEP